ncbi:YfgM family protein [Guyparkeria sp.]|uniref:YfgM family protein n=1 Tax=Guyparkeria sp. TaxID=2035736 RepID=UPI00356A9328
MVASDEEQIERIRDWWAEHGRTVIAGIALGVVAIAGWYGWQGWQENRVASASAAFGALEQRAAADDNAEVVELAREVATAYDGTSYASLAWLLGAGVAVENNDLETAAAYLERATDSTRQPQLVATAELRLARVLWAEGDHAAALQRLNDAPAGFEGLYAELRGDILLDEGDLAGARSAYETAAASDAANGLLQLKLDSLPVAEAGGAS